MKRLAALVTFALLTLPVLAAERTVLSDEDVWKLYTEPSVKVTDVNGNSATLGAIGIGTILNEQFNFGAEVDGLVNDIKVDEDGDVIVRTFDLYYAGAVVGYTFMPSDLLHVQIQSLFGGGQVHTHADPALREETDSYAVIEPRAMVFINLTETVELGVGASYRYVSGFELSTADFSDSDLCGITGIVSLRVSEF